MDKTLLREFDIAKRISNRDYYENTIIRYIYAHGKATKKTFADLLGISIPSVSHIIDDLVKNNLLICQTSNEPSWGRSSGFYMINPNKSLIIGCLISPHAVEVALFDSAGEIINKFDKKFNFISSHETLLKHIKNAINIVMQNQDESKLVAINVGCHEVIDIEKGESVFMPHKAKWTAFSIRYQLASRYHVPVYVENDCNVFALSEKWVGCASPYKDFFVINLDYGVGAGIIINNYVYHGTSIFSGQVGHTPVTEYGIKCQCGNYGCLETLASEPALLNLLKSRLKKGYISDYFKDFDINTIEPDNFYAAIYKHDPVALRVIEDAAIHISYSIRNMIYFIAPEAIILTGSLTQAGEYLLKPIENAIISPFGIHTDTKVQITNLARSDYIKGTFYLWVEYEFKTRR